MAGLCVLEDVRVADEKKFHYFIMCLFSKTAVSCVTSDDCF